MVSRCRCSRRSRWRTVPPESTGGMIVACGSGGLRPGSGHFGCATAWRSRCKNWWFAKKIRSQWFSASFSDSTAMPQTTGGGVISIWLVDWAESWCFQQLSKLKKNLEYFISKAHLIKQSSKLIIAPLLSPPRVHSRVTRPQIYDLIRRWRRMASFTTATHRRRSFGSSTRFRRERVSTTTKPVAVTAMASPPSQVRRRRFHPQQKLTMARLHRRRRWQHVLPEVDHRAVKWNNFPVTWRRSPRKQKTTWQFADPSRPGRESEPLSSCWASLCEPPKKRKRGENRLEIKI